MQGKKTHEQQVRILERKPDMPDARQTDAVTDSATRTDRVPVLNPQARESEFPVSRGGFNQENRDHNKHNHLDQTGHKPQRHGPAEQKS
jgi:hypothetical protein